MSRQLVSWVLLTIVAMGTGSRINVKGDGSAGLKTDDMEAGGAVIQKVKDTGSGAVKKEPMLITAISENTSPVELAGLTKDRSYKEMWPIDCSGVNVKGVEAPELITDGFACEVQTEKGIDFHERGVMPDIASLVWNNPGDICCHGKCGHKMRCDVDPKKFWEAAHIVAQAKAMGVNHISVAPAETILGHVSGDTFEEIFLLDRLMAGAANIPRLDQAMQLLQQEDSNVVELGEVGLRVEDKDGVTVKNQEGDSLRIQDLNFIPVERYPLKVFRAVDVDVGVSVKMAAPEETNLTGVLANVEVLMIRADLSFEQGQSILTVDGKTFFENLEAPLGSLVTMQMAAFGQEVKVQFCLHASTTATVQARDGGHMNNPLLPHDRAVHMKALLEAALPSSGVATIGSTTGHYAEEHPGFMGSRDANIIYKIYDAKFDAPPCRTEDLYPFIRLRPARPRPDSGAFGFPDEADEDEGPGVSNGFDPEDLTDDESDGQGFPAESDDGTTGWF